MKDWPHVYAHVDMDAFFVSVELLRRPQLRGKPVIVAGSSDPRSRGVVMTASYEARRFGVGSAMPISTAMRRCPQAVVVPPDIELYRRGSKAVMEILRGFSDLVEVAGMDEAYVDLSSSRAPKARARQIKRDVLAATRLVCSVGLAPNKLLAKIASDLDKPDGFTVLRREDMLDRVGDHKARLLPGVGPKTAERLERAGIETVAELAGAADEALVGAIGPRHGPALRNRALGIDDRPVVSGREPKSESRETTFAVDVDNLEELREQLVRLGDGLCERLASNGYRGRTVTLKIRLAPFRTFTRSRTLKEPTADRDLIVDTALALLERFERDAPVRLLGVGVAGLVKEEAERDAPAEQAGASDRSPQLRLAG
ncbi:MAG: DNA polymerase IV [Solirubrobacterales bacterium]